MHAKGTSDSICKRIGAVTENWRLVDCPICATMLSAYFARVVAYTEKQEPNA